MTEDRQQWAAINAVVEYGQLGLQLFPVWTVREGRCACAGGAGCGHPGKHPMTRHGLNSGRRRLWAFPGRRFPPSLFAEFQGSHGRILPPSGLVLPPTRSNSDKAELPR